MNFGFTEEQEMLRAEVRKFLDERSPIDEVRRAMGTPQGYSTELYQELAELGWLGLIAPEVHGGSGLRFEDLVVVLEEVGRSLLPSPLIPCALATALILDAGSDEQCARWLPGIVAGDRVATVAILETGDEFSPDDVQLRAEGNGDHLVLSGEKRYVTSGGQADLLLVAARTGEGEEDLTLVAIEGDTRGVHVEEIEVLDATKQAAHVRFDHVKVARSAELATNAAAWSAVSRHLDRGAVAVSAEAAGAFQAALDLTVGYAKQRIQFGSPIGRYQGVKHPLADCYVDLESLRSLVYHAAWAVDSSPAELPMAAAKAKAMAAEAFSKMGVIGIQLHGAVGYTEDYDIQLFLRRSKWVRAMYGDEDYHFDRIALLGGL